MDNQYYNNLISNVIQCSVSQNWADAVHEWEIVDCEEDDSMRSYCICGKEGLKYLFTIANKYNGKMLFPIGSTCIKKFERSELNDIASVKEGLFKLLHAIDNNEFITLDSEYFSRKLLRYLYDDGAFIASQYNNFDPIYDYDFLLQMFNKRDKSSITSKQQRKVSAIIISQIKPYLIEELSEKININ